MTFPPESVFSLGVITTTSGALVPIDGNVSATYADLFARVVVIRALSTNTNDVYVGKTGFVKATGVGVYTDLQPAESVMFSAAAGCTLRVGDFYVDVTTNGEGVRAFVMI